MTTTTDEAVRCSTWARTEHLDPIGTAGSYTGFVLVETPLPWPRDVSELPELAAIGALELVAGYRLQALVPADPGRRRIVVHSAAGDDWYSAYRRYEGTAAESGPSAEVARLMAAAAEGAESDPGRDVLICTHGRRDVCCGALGTELALEMAAGVPSGRAPDVAVRRTSHTGGHRFAPTFFVLPEGTGWAFADPGLLRVVLDRSVDFELVADRYRGCAGLAGPRVQAVEREVARRVGWHLLDRPRRGLDPGHGSEVRLEVATPSGATEVWEADVVPGRTLPVPDCMHPLSEARKTETEWAVGGLRRL